MRHDLLLFETDTGAMVDAETSFAGRFALGSNSQ